MNSSFFDDGELLVRASAVLKSQGPENGARGRPGKFQFFLSMQVSLKKSYYEKTRPRPGCCGERRSAARALRKRFFLKPKSDGYASLLGVLPLFCFVGCYPATRGRAFREWPLSGPGSGRWAEFLGGLTALKNSVRETSPRYINTFETARSGPRIPSSTATFAFTAAVRVNTVPLLRRTPSQ